jgi:hypothetical protein
MTITWETPPRMTFAQFEAEELRLLDLIRQQIAITDANAQPATPEAKWAWTDAYMEAVQCFNSLRRMRAEHPRYARRIDEKRLAERLDT